MLSELEILSAFRNGKLQLALDTLYVSLLPKVKSYVTRNSGTVEDAQDIFQDAVMILYKQVKSNKIDESLNLNAFVYTVAKNLWINKAKRNKKVVFVDEVPEGDKIEDNVLSSLITKERETQVRDVLQSLGEQCFKLIRAVFYENYSLAEAAKLLGFSSPEVAHTTNYRCKKKLIDLVKENKEFKSLLKVYE